VLASKRALFIAVGGDVGTGCDSFVSHKEGLLVISSRRGGRRRVFATLTSWPRKVSDHSDALLLPSPHEDCKSLLTHVPATSYLEPGPPLLPISDQYIPRAMHVNYFDGDNFLPFRTAFIRRLLSALDTLAQRALPALELFF
jgi:hypothetical protein